MNGLEKYAEPTICHLRRNDTLGSLNNVTRWKLLSVLIGLVWLKDLKTAESESRATSSLSSGVGAQNIKTRTTFVTLNLLYLVNYTVNQFDIKAGHFAFKVKGGGRCSRKP